MGKGKQGQTEKDTLCVRVWETNKGTDKQIDIKIERQTERTKKQQQQRCRCLAAFIRQPFFATL